MPHTAHMSYCANPADRAAHGPLGECEVAFTAGGTVLTVSALPGSGEPPDIRGTIEATTLAEFDEAVALQRTVRDKVAKWSEETRHPDR